MTDRDGQLPLPGAPAEPAGTPRGPGRPKGARNKRGRDWQAYAASLKVHPLEFMLADLQKSDRELAIELELWKRDPKTHEVIKDAKGAPVLRADALVVAHAMRKDAAREALPYIEQKLPQLDEDDAKTDKRIVLIVGEMSQNQAQQAEQAFGFRLKQNQRVIDAEPAKSDDTQSDGEPNLLTFNEDR